MSKKSKEIKKNIPDEIKVLFGKYYIFSFIIILALAIFYPLVVLNYFSIYTQIGFLVFAVLFDIYMTIGLFKKKGRFMSILVPILIGSVFLLLILDLLKLLDFI